MTSNVRRRSKIESSENNSSSSIALQKDAEPIVINGRNLIYSVAVLTDGKHVVSGDDKGKIRRRRIEDGKEVGTPMDVKSAVYDIVVSRDGKWIVSGTESGRVTVWNAESHSKVTEFNAHSRAIHTVDVSPDTRKIATGSSDGTACIWSLSTGERLLSPLEHIYPVVAAKFSPDGSLVATATVEKYVRVYGSDNGSLLGEFPVEVYLAVNHSIAWASDNKKLFASSGNGCLHHIDVFTKTTLSQWRIHSGNDPTCIALVNNSTFITASGSSVAFWDATSQNQIGTNIKHSHKIDSMTLSSNYDLVTSGDKKITIRTLRGILPSHYLDSTSRSPEIRKTKAETVGDNPNEKVANLEATIRELRIQLAESQKQANNPIQSVRTQEERLNSNNARLENTVQELRDKLVESRRTANEEKHGLKKTIDSLRADFRIRDESSSGRITQLEQTSQELRVQLSDSQWIIDAHKQKHECESLYTQGRIRGAAECLLKFANTVNEDVRADKVLTDFLTEFTPRCIMALERVGDEASNAGDRDEAVATYSIALSLSPTAPRAVLTKWATIMLFRGSPDEASSAATKFKVPSFVVYRVICDILERNGRLVEAAERFRQMQDKLPENAGVPNDQAEWELDFRGRFSQQMEKAGDIMRDSKKHDKAGALSLNPTNNDILLKRSREDNELELCRKKCRSSAS